MVSPVDQVYVTLLFIERIKGDVQLAGSDELSPRDPVHQPVRCNAHTETLKKQLIIDGLSAENNNKKQPVNLALT